MRREAPSSRTSLPSDPSSDSTACMPGCRHDRAPSRGQSRKPVRPSGMTKPSAWRAFLRPAAYRTFWNAPRVEKGRTAPKHPPFLVRAGANLAESPAGHRPSLAEHPQAGASRTAYQTRWSPAPSGQRSPRNGQATGQLPGSSRASSRVVRFPALQHSLHFPPALKDRHLPG